MSNYKSHAWTEFRAAGWIDDNNKFKDDMQEAICNNVLKLLDVFADEGHSGTSAPYALNLFSTLAKFEPIGPITGEGWEWVTVFEQSGSTLYQNKRACHVFKDNNGAYDIDGKVFWEWYRAEDGTISKSYYTGSGSRVPVTFPYTVPEKPIYEYRHSDAEPKTPAQNEAGFL